MHSDYNQNLQYIIANYWKYTIDSYGRLFFVYRLHV